jgi:hypothetical protein
MLRKLKWRLPGEPLAARYNWCQGPAVEKHCLRHYNELDDDDDRMTGETELILNQPRYSQDTMQSIYCGGRKGNHAKISQNTVQPPRFEPVCPEQKYRALAPISHLTTENCWVVLSVPRIISCQNPVHSTSQSCVWRHTATDGQPAGECRQQTTDALLFPDASRFPNPRHFSRIKSSVTLRCIAAKIKGKHKDFPWFQTFITRKLRGILKYWMLKRSNVL